MKLNKYQLKPLLNHYQLDRPFCLSDIFESDKPVDIEIGSGQGEYLTSLAKQYPRRNFLGVELIWERICKTLNKITPKGQKESQYKNVRLVRCDAWGVFERLIDQKSIENIYCLFPCPWPKKKHLKYRLFSYDFLKLLNNRLKDDGCIKFVTDYEKLYEWILEESHQTGFKVESKKIQPQFATKFEKKWQAQGQNEFFQIDFIKQKHIDVSVKEDVPMNSYKIDTFDSTKFNWADIKGDMTIILKDALFDRERQVSLIHLIVSEEHLTQNIRVMVSKKDSYWRVALAEGQDYFPTEGVKKAIESVYLAVK